MSSPPTLLAFDPDPAHARVLSQAFTRAGLTFRLALDARRAASAIRTHAPDLVFLHAEPDSREARDLLEGLIQEPWAARIPVVLLAADAKEQPLVSQFRTGLVEILRKPFHAAQYPARVQALLAELPTRTGMSHGQNVPRIVEHLRRTFRTGQLEVNPGTQWASVASFVHGVLSTAAHLGTRGDEALSEMLALGASPWSFTELSGADGDGVGVLLELKDEAAFGEEIQLETSDEVAADAPTDPGALPGTPILLVDDDPELCRMFKLLFQRHGYEVTTATDGFEGFEAALQKEHALVVADLNMPRLDGWGLLRKLREDYRTRELPFALLSCQDDYRESLKALDAGAQAYFSKSTRLDQLAQKVKALLEPRRKFEWELASGTLSSLSPQELGPQWLLREFARAGVTGTLTTGDAFAAYTLSIKEGTLVEAEAQAGRHRAQGVRALNAFIASRCPDGIFLAGEVEGEGQPLVALLDRAVHLLNENAQRLREAMLVNAATVEVNLELYRVYHQNGPKQWLETARLLCEEKLSPRDVMMRVDESPLEVEEALRDLVRRGVITLSV